MSSFNIGTSWRTASNARAPAPVGDNESAVVASQVSARQTLFRHEIIEFQQHTRQWGRVVPLQPLPIRFMVWLIAMAVAAAVAFLFLAQYARKETALGYLVPSAGSARIFAQQQGTIS